MCSISVSALPFPPTVKRLQVYGVVNAVVRPAAFVSRRVKGRALMSAASLSAWSARTYPLLAPDSSALTQRPSQVWAPS